QDYVNARLAEKAQPATINRELAALRRMFRLHKLDRRHQPDIRLLDESGNVRQGFIEPADFDGFLAHLPEALADAALFAYLSLWRRENVLALKWEHVSLTRNAEGRVTGGKVRLPHELTKNKAPLTLVLAGGRLLDLFQRRWAQRRLDCVYVFHTDG